MKESVDTGLFFLRLAAGGIMLGAHGIPKLLKFSTLSETFPDPIGLGSFISYLLAVGAEVGAAALILIGVYVRLATIPLIVTMGVAAFIVHSADPFSQKELAIVYLMVYVALFFTGGGSYTLDQLLKKK